MSTDPPPPPPIPDAIGTDELLRGIDRGIEAHLAWNQRLLRCALLRESPGDDMLRPTAHHLCQLGCWLDQSHEALARYDASTTAAMLAAHQQMHDATRTMCVALLAGQPTSESIMLDFDRNQRRLVELLHTLRLRVAEAAHRIDVLTGLPLRHGLLHGFQALALQAAKSGTELWLAMIDIDRFKAVNDTHGHPVGDQALKHIAQVLSAGLRDHDLLLRYGGEEFLGLFLLPDAAAATQLAQRMVEAVREQPLRTRQGLVLDLTATMGWTAVRPGEGLEQAIERADRLMLQGKQMGRDRFVLSNDSLALI
ncbi:diguanylate cyclase [Serpentinimonas maccroryi]|jgi:diguanylate cyclase (GGDEF)-like protein|uniref:diguanylate cyclase n=1 Tax=Serpentinimonas maccroryi TaxID=1458426 RepID=UPI002034A02B|nr:diguanylate cyclase [Serpentinimonas maccroryi]MCM2479094.1 diguanylate cyclase [Serpentinimonas maccroryi]